MKTVKAILGIPQYKPGPKSKKKKEDAKSQGPIASPSLTNRQGSDESMDVPNNAKLSPKKMANVAEDPGNDKSVIEGNNLVAKQDKPDVREGDKSEVEVSKDGVEAADITKGILGSGQVSEDTLDSTAVSNENLSEKRASKEPMGPTIASEGILGGSLDSAETVDAIMDSKETLAATSISEEAFVNNSISKKSLEDDLVSNETLGADLVSNETVGVTVRAKETASANPVFEESLGDGNVHASKDTVEDDQMSQKTQTGQISEETFKDVEASDKNDNNLEDIQPVPESTKKVIDLIIDGAMDEALEKFEATTGGKNWDKDTIAKTKTPSEHSTLANKTSLESSGESSHASSSVETTAEQQATVEESVDASSDALLAQDTYDSTEDFVGQSKAESRSSIQVGFLEESPSVMSEDDEF